MSTPRWTDLTYTEGFDLGQQDFAEGKPRRTKRPRNSNGSAGRFGYSDGYTDAWEKAMDTLDHIPGPSIVYVERDPKADHDHVYSTPPKRI